MTRDTNQGSYTVVVSNSAGSVTSSAGAMLTVTIALPNDSFANRTVLNGPNAQITSTNVGASKEPAEPNHGGYSGGHSVWWSWTAPATGIVKLDTNGSNFDTVLAVYAGNSVGGLTGIASDDDSGGGVASQLTFNAVAGATYQIAVDGVFMSSGIVLLNLSLATPPTITLQPMSVDVIGGSTVALTASASGGEPLFYQWRKNGLTINGANRATLIINSVSPADEAGYSLRVSNSLNSTVSSTAFLSLKSPQSVDMPRLSNLSVRSRAGTDSQTLIVGFVVGGASSGGKPILVRATGPALGTFGVTGVLTDPRMTLYNGTTPVASNDNWSGDAQVTLISTQVGAFALNSASSKDAALYRPAQANGACSVQVTGVSGTTGIALAEIYDATLPSSWTSQTPRLINLSARGESGSGGDILIAGFVIGGTAAKTVLIRGIGPALTPFGVGGALADPKLEIFKGTTKIAENDDWGGNAALSAVFAKVGAFALTGTISKDSSLLITLPPGAYSAQVGGVAGTTGVVLVEIYEVP